MRSFFLRSPSIHCAASPSSIAQGAGDRHQEMEESPPPLTHAEASEVADAVVGRLSTRSSNSGAASWLASSVVGGVTQNELYTLVARSLTGQRNGMIGQVWKEKKHSLTPSKKKEKLLNSVSISSNRWPVFSLGCIIWASPGSCGRRFRHICLSLSPSASCV